MSATTAAATARTGAQRRPRAEPRRPALHVVESAASAAGRLPFVILVGAVLASGLVVLLMLHTFAAQDAFRLHDLQRRTAALGDVEQQLALADQQAQAPSTLAARARALGMVPTGTLKFTKRRNGVIVAVASAVPVAPPAPKPTATPAGTPSAAASPTPARTKPANGHSAHPRPKPTRRPH